MVTSFKGCLSGHLQDQAMLVPGDYNTVIRKIGWIYSAQQLLDRERIRYISEEGSLNAKLSFGGIEYI